MSTQRHYGGSSGTPIQLRQGRQTEEPETPARYRQPTRKQPVTTDDENPDAWTVGKTPSSVVRRTTQFQATPTKRIRRVNWGNVVIVVGICMIIMLLGFIAVSWLGNWWTTQTNDWTYGRPRTYQTDHIVGHNDNVAHPSHFIAENLNRHVVVIELPGGDPAKAKIYLGPVLLGDGQDLIPVTLSFEDRNGDGKSDLNIHIGDQVIVFLNDGKQFVAAPQQN